MLSARVPAPIYWGTERGERARTDRAFEQEFVYTGNEERPGDAYSLGVFRRQGGFGESLVAALRVAGVAPDSFLPKYGPRQF